MHISDEKIEKIRTRLQKELESARKNKEEYWQLAEVINAKIRLLDEITEE